MAEIDRWTYELESPFLPPHEIEALAAEGVGYDEAEAIGEEELAETEEAFDERFTALGEEELDLGELDLAEDGGGSAGLGTFESLVALETGSGTSFTSRLAGMAALAMGPTLRRGSRGSAVGALQRVLVSLGHPLTVDDDFGPNTDRAVRAFQASAGLGVDGVVGPDTKRALAAALASRGQAPSPAPTPPPAPGGTTDWTAVGTDARLRYVMDRLVNRYGYPVNGAAGVVGNLYAESGVLPSRVEGSRPEAPMRAQNFARQTVTFTPDEIMQRDRQRERGPRLAGIGLAQWTSPGRRSGLFQHVYEGRQAGAAILFDMDAQIDYLVSELRRSYSRVNAMLMRPDVSAHDAADEVVYSFEIPGRLLGVDRKKLPRTHPRVQEVFRTRRGYADRALRAYRAAGP